MAQPMTFQEAVDLVLAEMRHIMIIRQRKYGPENIRGLGLLGVLQRALHDKGSRLLVHYEREDLRQRCLAAGMPQDVVDEHLPPNGDYADESVDDAHIDLANYAGPIGIMLRRGWWGLPLADDPRE